MSTLEKRMKVMEWWHNLKPTEKQKICNDNQDILLGARIYDTLTGREIELVYEKIHNSDTLFSITGT